MTIEPGVELGSYRIVSLVGRGAMGEVWKAVDSRLGRDVAIKVLPDEFAVDENRRARFEREARLLASMNHPNVGAIYGFEDLEGKLCLILEFVGGSTLTEMCRRGPIPLDEAIDIAIQITEAVEAAHHKGVVHRDLKPANIKVTSEGRVKVLDFGLAKVGAAAEQGSTDSTLTLDETESGSLMGTGPYMSPEQVKGREADRTTDMWAFGCVLFEMLTGTRLFDGETVGDILAAVLRSEPALDRLPANVGPGIRRLLGRCLRRDKALRLHDMADARVELLEVKAGLDAEPAPPRPGSPTGERLVWGMVLAGAATLIAVLAFLLASRPTAPEMRLDIATAETSEPTSLAISPDGLRIVFRATSEGRSRLWLRSLSEVSASPLDGTDGGLFPFWSPDSRSVGFFADGQLKRLDLENGTVRILAPAPAGRGGSWNHEGTIVFAANLAGPLSRVSAEGGPVGRLTMLDAAGESSHRYPQFLPDGSHFIYYVTGAAETTGAYISNLEGSLSRRLVASDAAAVYASNEHVLFVRDRTLFAQPIDLSTYELEGSPFVVAEGILLNGSNLSAVSASDSGTVIFRTGDTGGPRQLVWVDRAGAPLERIGGPDAAAAINAALSPDGGRVALQRTVNENIDIWIYDERGSLQRFTSDPAEDTSPIWSGDGTRIVFSKRPGVVFDLYVKPVSGASDETRVLTTGLNNSATDWHPSRDVILYRSPDPETGWDIWALPLGEGEEARPVVRTGFDERDGQFSPDGNWVAYQSDESGRYEIYVQPFPGPGGRWTISTDGGAQPRWADDGREIDYIDLAGRMMAVPIRLDAARQMVEAQEPVPLFPTAIGGAVQGILRQQYMVSEDGQRFLMHAVTEETTVLPITVLLDWNP